MRKEHRASVAWVSCPSWLEEESCDCKFRFDSKDVNSLEIFKRVAYS